MNARNAYPLTWPAGRPRTQYRKLAAFQNTTVAKAVTVIYHELSLLGVKDAEVVISTNIELRLDGTPRSDQKLMPDPGAAVYFKLKGKDTVLSCDKWNRVEHNLWAIGLDIEAQRGRMRWGCTTVEQAFAGYQALTAGTESRPWWIVLGFQSEAAANVADLADLRERYRNLSMQYHPDRGGDEFRMSELNDAWSRAKRERGIS